LIIFSPPQDRWRDIGGCLDGFKRKGGTATDGWRYCRAFLRETNMMKVSRRALMALGLAAIPAVYASRALAVDALPDARFVGYA
jgi:hypothetical protein